MMDFTPLTAADRTEPYVPPQTLRDRGWRQMKKNRLALWGLAIVVIMSILAIAGPWLAPYTYADQDLTAANAWPSAAHWFGTDSLGRDLLVRVRIVVPRHLSDEERDLWTRLLEIGGSTPPQDEKKGGFFSDLSDLLGGKKK